MFAPSPREALDAVLRDTLNAMQTAHPGRIVRYYPDRQTVDVAVCVMREVPGEDWEPDEFEEIPEVVNVPVVFPRAGGFVITFPLKAGDYVALFCGTTNTLVWRDKGGINQKPGLSGDEFGLNGCFVMPGYFPDNREHTLKNVDTENFTIRRVDGGPGLVIKPSGEIEIKSSSISAGPGVPGAAQPTTKDDNLHKYLDALVQVISSTFSLCMPPPGGPPPQPAFDLALQALSALKEATAATAVKVE